MSVVCVQRVACFVVFVSSSEAGHSMRMLRCAALDENPYALCTTLVPVSTVPWLVVGCATDGGHQTCVPLGPGGMYGSGPRVVARTRGKAAVLVLSEADYRR